MSLGGAFSGKRMSLKQLYDLRGAARASRIAHRTADNLLLGLESHA